MRRRPLPKTLEEANILLDTIRLKKEEGLVEALKFLFVKWPALQQTTHEHLGYLLGMSRETISRNIWKAI